MEQNVRLYPVYQGLMNLLFWMPVFFLYFSSALSLDQVLLLEAVYYLSVVLLEVPSGYFSDRVGRKPTLLVAAGAWSIACAVFALSSGFWPFCVAQVLLAAGMAFNSGTDSSFHFESLASLGRTSEFEEREGRTNSIALTAGAVSALGGGLAAGFDLRWTYALSSISAAGAFLVVLACREPERPAESGKAASPLRQVGACLRRTADPVLLWVFVFVVAMTVFNHVPYEFFQPYLGFLMGEEETEFARTPVASGGLLAIMMLLGAWASRNSSRLRIRIGVIAVLLIAMAVQGAVIESMAVWLHPAVLLLVLLRAVPRGLATPVVNATVHPRIESGIRATYLSVQSLTGRLAFSGSLFLSSWIVGEGAVTSYGALSGLMIGYGSACAGVFLLLLMTARAVQSRITPTSNLPSTD